MGTSAYGMASAAVRKPGMAMVAGEEHFQMAAMDATETAQRKGGMTKAARTEVLGTCVSAWVAVSGGVGPLSV